MHRDLRADLERQGYLIPTPTPGIYGTDGRFAGLVRALGDRISALAAGAGATVLCHPPALPTADLARVGYLRSFPHLAGAISVCPREREAQAARLHTGGTWTDLLEPADLSPAPAACYPVYRMLAGRQLPALLRYETTSWCFRREPSEDPFRMQYFRMQELVWVGPAPEVAAFLPRAHDLAAALFADLGLPVECAPATDPFFGPGGRVLAREQRERDLKQEYRLDTGEQTVALASVNHHEAHFTRALGITGPDRAPAASACLGFGLDRIALALLARPGPDPAAWPIAHRSASSGPEAGPGGPPEIGGRAPEVGPPPTAGREGPG